MKVIKDGVDITYRYVYKIPLKEEDFNIDNILATRLVVFKLEDLCKLIGVSDLSMVIPDYLKFVSPFWFDDILKQYNSEKVFKGLELLRSIATGLTI